MKHLKLLVLLMAAMMSVVSYGQAGTGGGVAEGGGATIQPAAEVVGIHCDLISFTEEISVMMGSGTVMGTAQNVTTLHATLPEGTPFGFYTESSETALMQYIDSLSMRMYDIQSSMEQLSYESVEVQMRISLVQDSASMLDRMIQDSVSAGLEVSPATYAILDNMLTTIDSLTSMTYVLLYRSDLLMMSLDSIYLAFQEFEYPKEMDIDMTNYPDGVFYLPVMYYGPYADYSATLSLSANGETATVVVYATTEEVEPIYPQPGDSIVGEPSIEVYSGYEVKFDLFAQEGGGPYEGLGVATGMAWNMSTLRARISSGNHFAIATEIVDPATGAVEIVNMQEMEIGIDPENPQFYIQVIFFADEEGSYVDTLFLGNEGMEPTIIRLEGNVMSGGIVTKYIYAEPSVRNYDGPARQGYMIASDEITAYAAGVNDISARLASGNSYPFQLLQPSEEGYLDVVDVLTYSDLGGAATDAVFRLCFATGTPGSYYDTLVIYSSDPDVQPIYIPLEGLAYEYTPEVREGILDLNTTELNLSYRWTEIADNPMYRMRQQRIYFTYNNVDSIIVTISDTTNFKLWSSDYGTVYDESYLTDHLYIEGTQDWLRSNYAGVFFRASEPGEYEATVMLTPYGAENLEPVFVPIHAEVIDDTQPRISVDSVFTMELDKDDSYYWQNSIFSFNVYPENIDTIHYRLAEGSKIHLYDYAASQSSGIRPTELDSSLLSTEFVAVPRYNDWYGTYEWDPVYLYLFADEGGEFVDTLYISAKGVAKTYKVVLRGNVKDWNSTVSWRDNNVIVTLIGDSLIVSGSGSTSDYNYGDADYSYRYTPWYSDIRYHRDYQNYPKHLVVQPGVSRLGHYAFYSFQFSSIDLGELDSIGRRTFNYTYQMDSIVLPSTLRFIDCNGFYSYGMYVQKVINNLPADIEMCDNPFSGWYGIRQVVANTTQLLAIGNPSNTLVIPATPEIRDIYVAYGYLCDEPETGYDLVVGNYVNLDPAAVSQLPIKPSVILDYSKYREEYRGQLSMPIDASLDMSRFVKKDYLGKLAPFYAFEQWVNYGNSHEDYTPGYLGVNTSLINEGVMTADTVELREEMVSGYWVFMGLPFSQQVSEIGMPAGTYYSIRRFNAAEQALGHYNYVWEDVQPQETLQAGEPFIIQITNADRRPAQLTFMTTNDADKQDIFSPAQASLPLQMHPAEDAWNANWNYLANPYPCFYDTRAIGTSGVITVYANHVNGMEYYRSFSLQDDYYVLQPHEAFFYQAASDETVLRMPLEGKQHVAAAAGVEYDPSQFEWYEEEQPQAPARNRRMLLNFFLAQNNNEDRARVVINEAASMDYEVGVDALKMFAPGSTAAHFYAEQGGAQQSILERPMGNGMVYMGARLMETGDCTISIPETNGLTIHLYDTETGVLTNLSEDNYTFYGTPGEYNGRFIIGLSGSPTAIEDFISGLTENGVKKVIENGHVFILRGSDKFDVLGNKH